MAAFSKKRRRRAKKLSDKDAVPIHPYVNFHPPSFPTPPNTPISELQEMVNQANQEDIRYCAGKGLIEDCAGKGLIEGSGVIAQPKTLTISAILDDAIMSTDDIYETIEALDGTLFGHDDKASPDCEPNPQSLEDAIRILARKLDVIRNRLSSINRRLA